MKVSYNWLQSICGNDLPDVAKVAEVLTTRSFEVESVEDKNGDFILDIDILPNRAHDCLSHYGIAKELGVVLGLQLKKENFGENNVGVSEAPLQIEVSDEKLCRRYIGRSIENVKTGPSPDWLKERLESIGQKSINNIVDATNFVMFHYGQPLHAFDKDKLDGSVIKVRMAEKGESLVTLDGNEVELTEDVLVIADEKDALAIAGIKGGNKAEVDANTKNIILESANFESSNIRLTSRKVGVVTDSSKRFEVKISPNFAEKGMDAVSALILEIAGTEETQMGEKKDFYPRQSGVYKVGVSLAKINKVLGAQITEKEVGTIFDSLGFRYEKINTIKKVLELATQFEGVPYKYGASVLYDAPRAFDCSSFTAYLFAQAGISIPRISIDQYFYGEEVEENNLKPGDIIFSDTGRGKTFDTSVEFMKGLKIDRGIDHCGLYLGDGKIIHASRHNGTGEVDIEDLSESEQFQNIVGIRSVCGGDEERFVVSVPEDRLDIRISEDLIEEVGRVYGYENIKDVLPKGNEVSSLNKEFLYKDIVRNILVGIGFSEVYTYSFVEKGDDKVHIELLNPLANNRPFLRHNLFDELSVKLDSNAYYGDLLGVDKIKIFEVGKVFSKDGESNVLGIVVRHLKKKRKIEEENKEVMGVLGLVLSEFGLSYEQKGEVIFVSGIEVGRVSETIIEINLDKIFSGPDVLVSKDWSPENIYIQSPSVLYKRSSKYPFVSRDISMFVPSDVESEQVSEMILKNGGDLIVNIYLFDVFEKDDKKSLAFRLIFQSYDKTLEDGEVNEIMEKINSVLIAKDFQIR